MVIHAEDLSLTTMRKKASEKLPLRALRGFKQTIRFLKAASQRYREAARNAVQNAATKGAWNAARNG